MASTVGQMFRERVPGYGNRDALFSREGSQWRATTWAQLDANVRALTLALDAMGIKRGEAVAILANTREEWTTLDVALMSAGYLVVGIYQSELADKVEFILDNCDAVAVFVEDKKQLEKVELARPKLPKLRHVFGIMSDGVPKGGKGYAEILAEGTKLLSKDAKRFDALVDAVKPGDLATLVYTSGTTGMPKGAMLTHGNFTSICDAVRDLLEVKSSDSTVLFLPLAHIFARVTQYFNVFTGIAISYPPYGFTPDVLFQCFEERTPTFVTSVPRIFEKVYAGATAKLSEGSPLKKRIASWAFSVGRKASRERQAGREVKGLLAAQFGLADKLVFSKIKARFGGKVRFFVSGGAPLSREIQEWFHAADMLILEGYGLTETTAASTVNRPSGYRFGSVGLAVPGTQIRIAADGEIMIKGIGVFQGYFKRAEDTAACLDKDGWFASGDIGEFDADGFLRITDRKKDLIITAGGKNIAPQWIENKLKQIPLVSQAMVHGDKRKFISALITLNPDEVTKMGLKYEEAVKNAKVREAVEKGIAEKNKELESYQQVKKFEILEKDFTIDDGTLTPTLKVKRKVVTERFKAILDRFYVESGRDAA